MADEKKTPNEGFAVFLQTNTQGLSLWSLRKTEEEALADADQWMQENPNRASHVFVVAAKTWLAI